MIPGVNEISSSMGRAIHGCGSEIFILSITGDESLINLDHIMDIRQDAPESKLATSRWQ